MEKREAKFDREKQKETEKLRINQMAVENKKWAAVDRSDAKHMQKEA